EAADVANAVIDGSDAVMLSGETAAGKYPIGAVQMMDAIIREVEAEWIADEAGAISVPKLIDRRQWGYADAAARAAAMLSFTLPIKAIVTFTRDGRTARLISEYRPRSMVIAITARQEIANRLALEWG